MGLLSKKSTKTNELRCCLQANTVKAWQCSTDNYFLADIPEWVLEYCSIRWDKYKQRLIAYREATDRWDKMMIHDGDWIIQDIDQSIKIMSNYQFEMSFYRAIPIRKRGLLFNGAS